MRLVCSVALTNLEAVSKGFGGSKGVRSTLSVFKKGENTLLMWCTTKNKHGLRYKLVDNVEKIFSRMVSEGKATIRLKDPHLDLCVSGANAIDLQRLLNAIKVAHSGESLLGKGILSSSEPVQNRVIQKPKTKLVVNARQNYPLLDGFPSTLEQLSVENCSLLKVDSRMLKLRRLTTLNLSNNKIKSLPEDIAQLQTLIELNLENNNLTKLPESFCTSSSKLCLSLRSLKLNKNSIEYLPSNFDKLCELYQLHIQSNKLKFLPKGIGNLRKLKVLIASQNHIRILPGSMSRLSLEQIDLSANDFMQAECIPAVNKLKDVTSLQEMAARVVAIEKLWYNEESLTHFCREYIEQGKSCWRCRVKCFESYMRVGFSFNLSSISHTVVRMEADQVPIIGILCSRQCFESSRLVV